MQRMIEATLVGLNWEMCLPYLDDITIWANADTEEEEFEQSMERLELVLERLEWAGLRAKPSKCHLFATSVDYLGHICSRDGVTQLGWESRTTRPSCATEQFKDRHGPSKCLPPYRLHSNAPSGM